MCVHGCVCVLRKDEALNREPVCKHLSARRHVDGLWDLRISARLLRRLGCANRLSAVAGLLPGCCRAVAGRRESTHPRSLRVRHFASLCAWISSLVCRLGPNDAHPVDITAGPVMSTKLGPIPRRESAKYGWQPEPLVKVCHHDHDDDDAKRVFYLPLPSPRGALARERLLRSPPSKRRFLLRSLRAPASGSPSGSFVVPQLSDSGSCQPGSSSFLLSLQLLRFLPWSLQGPCFPCPQRRSPVPLPCPLLLAVLAPVVTPLASAAAADRRLEAAARAGGQVVVRGGQVRRQLRKVLPQGHLQQPKKAGLDGSLGTSVVVLEHRRRVRHEMCGEYRLPSWNPSENNASSHSTFCWLAFARSTCHPRRVLGESKQGS